MASPPNSSNSPPSPPLAPSVALYPLSFLPNLNLLLLLTPLLLPPKKYFPSSLSKPNFEAVAQLQEILDLQDAKQKIARDVRSKDSGLLHDDDADAGDDEDEQSVTTVASRLNLEDILSYAHRMLHHVCTAGCADKAPRCAFRLRRRTNKMRASQLYNFANLDVGLPKVVESKDKSIEAMIEPPPPMLVPEPNPLPNLAAILPNITVPSGWKPGMPVELPMDLPVPPPGWKPGDPVPLPPLDSLPAVPRMEEQQLRPLPGLHKPPETIQVRPVQLDILDQDDSSSDYSSEDASSEDDD
ncbi:hypothetical protein FNV43_RR14039 [Rhamnella rubrinervis]|uniref:Mediator of RNA polymerase II transcription subunit 4 n=1 Tax=Rhamnella rubrinervis TaxID=2594499 RepID=A0A8K0H2B3_9ROSA|nr:hypothetical protein FNV43_RR14039 [Rhamnella rubrinervis]